MPDNLKRYREKRDFTRTAEPKGIAAAKKGHRYLIQKHAATRLHYDFRLELDGVLKSWAVTRGPSLDPNDKRLAVEVEDHPVSYGGFEGTIPKGQYGGGTVMLWDEGTWEPTSDPHEGLKKGKLEFIIHGKRLHGEWALVRMKSRPEDKGRNNWLLIKHKDEIAHVGDKDKLLTKNITSIKTGRKMEEIAEAKDKVWQSKAKASHGSLPDFIKPELATLTDSLPKGKSWVHEIKFDGYRGLSFIENGKAKIFTRTGQDWTHKFLSIANLLKRLAVENAIIDGEIVALNDQEVSSFKSLQEALSNGDADQLQYYVFDLLYLNGKDLRKLPLTERKQKLKELIRKNIGGKIFYSEHFTEKEGFLKQVCAMQLEGIISKRANAAYKSGRDKTWLKTKCHKRQEFVIAGFTEPTHKERGIGALLIGYYEEEELVYAGKVGTGFNQELSTGIRKKLNKLKQKQTPFAKVPAEGRNAIWVKPKLVCEVEFTEWTKDGRLRHPSFQGLREDKPANTIGRDYEQAAPEQVEDKEKKPAAKSKSSKDVTVGGIKITHPDRIIYPGFNITKQNLAEYYLEVADQILPYVKNRPLSMLRCPEGITKECFFQRHIAKGQLPYIYDTGVAVKGRDEDYLMIKDVRGLLTLVQWGVIELHPWGCLADKPDLPDRIIFDLDPDPELPFKYVIEGAKEIAKRMQEFGLKSFVKTTGGKGLHVVIPINRKYGWPAIKAFARAIAESMQGDNPKRYIATSSKASRKGKIFVDYLRNDLTSTAVAPFSARAREGAAVAMPVSWEELKSPLNPKKFTILTIAKRLKQLKSDPWDDFLKIKQNINAKYLKALKINTYLD